MTTGSRLSAEDRDFFGLVSRAAFSNPFSDDRAELDRKIAGGPREDCGIGQVVARVRERLRKLQVEGKADIRGYHGEERLILQSAFLFDVFHSIVDDFDCLIGLQIKAGERSCPVPFAGSALALLAGYGFDAEECFRFFSIFYQIRRAFYFIHRGLVGRCPSMRRLRLRLWDNVFTHDIRWYEHTFWNRMEDFSTLLLGETGTGKGTAAAAIGRSGFIPFDDRKGCFAESFAANFASVHLSQYSEALIESELFGHRKGAFTGAIDHHQGILGRCSPHGSIFLDEIGDVSLPIQVKLLQVLQERTFSPVGSHEKVRFSGRVIAATNRALQEIRRRGLFRDDFFYRLCSDVILIPPLRQRLQEDAGELEMMTFHVLERIVGKPCEDLGRRVCAILTHEPGLGYPWPGNVRELEQAVRRILLTNRYEGDLGDVDQSRGMLSRLQAGVAAGTLDARTLVGSYCAMLHGKLGTYEEVARITGLDRRTVKKYIQQN